MIKSAFLALIISFLVLVSGLSQKINWISIQEAEKLNKQNPKKFIIDVYTDWCGWCVRMDQTTFSNPAIAKYINNNFYAVKFNAELRDSVFFAGQIFRNRGGGQRASHELAQALLQGKMSYPSIVYLNEKLQLLAPVPGFKTPEQLEPILIYFAENIYITTPWNDFQMNFKSKLFSSK